MACADWWRNRTRHLENCKLVFTFKLNLGLFFDKQIKFQLQRKRSNKITIIGVYLLSNTTIWWIDIYIIFIYIYNIYYIDNNYMFRHFSYDYVMST